MAVRATLEDGALVLAFDRPERVNTFTAAMHAELLDAFDRADADDAVRAVVVTGEGRAFCAGADLVDGGFPDPRQADPEAYRDSGGEVALRVFASHKPVIAAINGAAIGVGATMTLPMDVRLVADEARIGFPFCRRGIVPEACSSWFLPRVVGIATAMEWAVTGRLVGAEEAVASGFARSAHAQGELVDAALAIAREVATHTAPVSVALTRRMLWSMLTAAHPHEAHLIDSRATLSRFASADAQEGVASFLEKRAPAFPDRVSEGLPDVGLPPA